MLVSWPQNHSVTVSCAWLIGGEGKKGFVPPFVQKAMAGPEEQDNSSCFSAKTLELLAGEHRLQPISVSDAGTWLTAGTTDADCRQSLPAIYDKCCIRMGCIGQDRHPAAGGSMSGRTAALTRTSAAMQVTGHSSPVSLHAEGTPRLWEL